MDRLVQKVESSETLHPWPPAHSLARRLFCAVLLSSSSGANYWGVCNFFFSFALHQHVTQFKAGCHSALRLQSHCRRLSVASIANSETKSRRPRPRLVMDFPAFPWSFAALWVGWRALWKCPWPRWRLTAASESIIKKKKKKVWHLNKEHCHGSCYGEHATRKAIWDHFILGWTKSSWLVHYNPNVLQSGVRTPRYWS